MMLDVGERCGRVLVRGCSAAQGLLCEKLLPHTIQLFACGLLTGSSGRVTALQQVQPWPKPMTVCWSKLLTLVFWAVCFVLCGFLVFWSWLVDLQQLNRGECRQEGGRWVLSERSGWHMSACVHPGGLIFYSSANRRVLNSCDAVHTHSNSCESWLRCSPVCCHAGASVAGCSGAGCCSCWMCCSRCLCCEH